MALGETPCAPTYTSGNDAFVAKLDSSGSLVWNTFLGGDGNDEGVSIVVDGSGNTYITGWSDSTWGSPKRAYGGENDAFAAKLNASGELLWNTFLGQSGYDDGSAIAVDSSGNVYVGGTSNDTWGSPARAYASGNDAFAAKLDSSGNLTWNSFLGGDGTDSGRGIAVDGTGNVYLSGSSDAAWGSPIRDFTGNGDAFAAKLNSSGALTWNTFLGGDGGDSGTDVAVDNSGNVYVSGQSDASWGSPERAYTAGYDFFAAKLNSSGALTWNTFLGGDGTDSGGGIAVDSNGYVYVGATSDASWGAPVRAFSSEVDTSVAKLDPSGGLIWNTFLGGEGDDWGRDVAVDGNGNIYVVGFGGSWGNPTHFPYGADAFVVKVDTSGNPVWNNYIGTGGNDHGFGIVVDNSGNIYVSGHGNGTWGNPIRAFTDNHDVLVAKLDSSGNLLWNTFLGGQGIDFGNANLSVDVNGNIYVAGNSDLPWSCAPVNCTMRAYTGGTDAFIAKLDSSGSLIWNTFLGGSGDDSAVISTDGSGNIYVAGYSDASWGTPARAYTAGYDAFAAKVDSSGSLVWNTFLGGAGEDEALGITVNDSGIVFVEGGSDTSWGCSLASCTVRPYSAGADAFIAKLDPSGIMLWNTFLGGSGADNLQAAIALDSVGNIYISGFCDSTWGNPVRPFAGGVSDAFIAKVDSSGNLAWNTFLGGSGQDIGRGIVVDSLGSIHIVGISYESWGTPLEAYHGADDAFVARLDSTGSLNALTFLGASDSDWGRGIAEDTGGNLYITGRSFSSWGTPVNDFSGGGPDIFVAKIAFPPGVVSIHRASPNPTGSASVDFTVTFSENVYGVDTSDFTLALSGISSAYVQGVNGSGATRTVTVNTGAGSGSLRLDVIDDDSIHDSTDNSLGGSGVGNGDFSNGQAYDVDKTAPTVAAITRADANPTNAASVDFTVVFSESVIGVGSTDFTLTTAGVTGASITTVTGSNATYAVTVNTGTGDGALRLDIPNTAAVTDLNGNPLSGLPYTGGEEYSINKSSPILIAPADSDDTHTNRPAFQWNAVASATNYLIQISTLSDFSKVTKATLTAPTTTYTPKKDLLRNSTYYWRVAAKVGKAYGPWSETWSFTTGNPPPVPSLVAPGNKKSVTGPSPLFDWKDVKAIAGVTFGHYEIQISTDAGFATIFDTSTSTDSQYDGFTLLPGTYYWRVRSVADDGDFSAWSTVRIVIVQ